MFLIDFFRITKQKIVLFFLLWILSYFFFFFSFFLLQLIGFFYFSLSFFFSPFSTLQLFFPVSFQAFNNFFLTFLAVIIIFLADLFYLYFLACLFAFIYNKKIKQLIEPKTKSLGLKLSKSRFSFFIPSYKKAVIFVALLFFAFIASMIFYTPGGLGTYVAVLAVLGIILLPVFLAFMALASITSGLLPAVAILSLPLEILYLYFLACFLRWVDVKMNKPFSTAVLVGFLFLFFILPFIIMAFSFLLPPL